MGRRTAHTDGGSAALTLALGACILLAVAVIVAAPVAQAVTALGVARAAADAAALAGAGESPLAGGSDGPCGAAARVAAANTARLVACSGPDRGTGVAVSDGPQWPIGVQVDIAVDLDGPLSALGPVHASAAAELRPHDPDTQR